MFLFAGLGPGIASAAHMQHLHWTLNYSGFFAGVAFNPAWASLKYIILQVVIQT